MPGPFFWRPLHGLFRPTPGRSSHGTTVPGRRHPASRQRVHVAPHQWMNGARPEPEEWFLIEWPEGAKKPSHYWLSTFPQDPPPEDGLHGQAPVAYRTRLSAAEGRTRPGPLRGQEPPRMAATRHPCHPCVPLPSPPATPRYIKTPDLTPGPEAHPNHFGSLGRSLPDMSPPGVADCVAPGPYLTQ